ncbi:LIN, partial [Symbiodinium microadriaticum]
LALFGEAPAPPLPPAPTKADKPTPTAPGLRDIVQNAPKELRCALDSKLLCDPVTTPGGIVFERSTLARWLQTHGATCPITGVALCLEECQRCPELRRQVTEWVRSDARRTGGRRKK